METYIRTLEKYIEKFKSGVYTETDFQSSIDSLIQQITESEFEQLRERLNVFESEMERINFTVDLEKVKDEYLKAIEKLESDLKHWRS